MHKVEDGRDTVVRHSFSGFDASDGGGEKPPALPYLCSCLL